MTFCKSWTSTYEFTAFTEADLLTGGDTNLNRGDSFTMPASATTCFTVSDNDRFLSGDCWDRATDWRGQTASITDSGDGAELGNGGQIYAEAYHVLYGSDGKCYYLIEIEQECGDAPGAGDDYFTFYGAVPPAGVTLTVARSCDAGSCSWIDFKCLGAGPKEEPTGNVSGRVFCDTDADGLDEDGVTVTLGDNLIVNGDFEQNKLNDSGASWGGLTAGWHDVGYGRVNVLEQDYGHGNATGDAVAELECGVVLRQNVNVTEAGTYVLSFNVSRRGDNDQDNTFELYVDGQKITTVVAQGQETLTFNLELDAGAHRFDFKSLSHSYKGAGLDDVELRQEITTVIEEPGKEGVTVILLDVNGDEILDEGGQRITTTTDADGAYSFTDLPAGDYRVKFEAPDGTEFTLQNVGSDDAIDSDVDANGVSDVFTVVANETTTDVDAGVKDKAPEGGALSGRYFCDDNPTNDIEDSTDTPVVGQLVTLLNADGTGPVLDIFGAPIEPVRTDDTGFYSFTDIPEGSYKVQFEAVAGKAFVDQGIGDDTNSSDVDENTPAGEDGVTEVAFVVVAGEETTDVDAGVVSIDQGTSEIGDTIWLDTFGDGVLESFEQTIDGVTVQLKDASGTVIDTQVTANGGQYLFTALLAGTYFVQVVPPAIGESVTLINGDGSTETLTLTADGVKALGFTVKGAGGDDTLDSDLNTDSGMTDAIVLGIGESKLTVDGGLIRCGLITGTTQSDPNSPVGGNDLLEGCDEADTISGRSGEDTLLGNGGDDILNGDDYDDVLNGGAGDDTLDGGNDVDRAVFSGNRADYTITPVDVNGGQLIVSGPDGTDIVSNVEFLVFDDGEVDVDTLFPGAVADAVAAPAAGGSVNIDVLANDNGADSVADVSAAAFGTVTIEANGTITYTAGADFNGYDVFSYTIVDADGHVDTAEVTVGELAIPQAGDPGVIQLDDSGVNFLGTPQDDIILGGAGQDTINASGGEDFVFGGKGKDTINGSTQDDTLVGGGGDDLIFGGGQNDLMIGGSGNDVLNGEKGADAMFGGAGDDVMFGSSGDDLMFGGSGDDDFRNIGSGADGVYGGAGDDTFNWTSSVDGAERDVFNGESGNDRLVLRIDTGADAVTQAAIQAEVDAYLDLVATATPATADPFGEGGALVDEFAFTTIELTVSNIESIDLIFS